MNVLVHMTCQFLQGQVGSGTYIYRGVRVRVGEGGGGGTQGNVVTCSSQKLSRSNLISG